MNKSKKVMKARTMMDALVYVLAEDFKQDITEAFVRTLHSAATLYLSRNKVPRVPLIQLSKKVTVRNFSYNVKHPDKIPKDVKLWITYYRRINVIDRIQPILDSYIQDFVDEAI